MSAQAPRQERTVHMQHRLPVLLSLLLSLLLLLLLLLLLPLTAIAQDIHFSQFFNTPYATSPASIGLFNGDYRVGGVFRQQWRSVTVPYRTFGIGGDARNFLGTEGLGVGAWLFNDRAGDSRMNTFHFSLGGSWTQRFGADRRHGITGGLQLGITALSLDRGELSFDAQYNGFYYDPSLDNGEDLSRDAMSHPDLHAGIIYRYEAAARESYQIGLSFFNLTTPDIGFLGEPPVPLDLRTAFHALIRFPVSDKVDVLPSIQYMAQGRFQELVIGGAARIIQFEKYGLRRAVKLGAYYRAADAGYLFGGIEYDAWDLGISYDFNLSSLVPASRYRGGLELTAVWIMRQDPPLPRYKACPDML